MPLIMIDHKLQTGIGSIAAKHRQQKREREEMFHEVGMNGKSGSMKLPQLQWVKMKKPPQDEAAFSGEFQYCD
jgi:hypothetical protein